MSFEVFIGGEENEKKVAERTFYESLLIHLGTHSRTYYLNGGSQTRRDMRNDYKDLANRLGLSCETTAFSVTFRRKKTNA